MLGKIAPMPMSLPQRQQQDVFYCPTGYQSEYTLFHTTRVIKYVFLDGSQNVAPLSPASPAFEAQVGYLEPAKSYYYPLVLPDRSLASSYWAPELERLPIFVTLSKSQEKLSAGWGRPLCSRDRLPVFRQLCGEGPTPASYRREETTGAQTLGGELEKPEVTKGLDKELEGDEEVVAAKEEEEEEESVSFVIPTATSEQEAKP